MMTRDRHASRARERTPEEQVLAELSVALQAVHRSLIATVGHQRERRGEAIQGPHHLFRLVQEDPQFAWLLPLSSLIVRIDDRLAEEESVDARAVATLRDDVERLLTGADPFAARYRELLQSDPGLVMEHARVRRVLRRLSSAGRDAN